MKLSIILPIYNVESFLSDCLDSLYAQDIFTEDYEIICVIDGSPDNSRQIVEQYMEKYSNIKLIVQKNKGVCAARNEGLKNAKGKYIWFVDPDDIIVSNCFGKIVAHMESTEADIFEMQYRTCEEEYKFIAESIQFQIEGENKPGSNGSGCLYICQKEYLLKNNILFDEALSYGEDYLWAFQIKYRKHKSIYTNAPLYIYRQRANSAMNTVDKKKTEKHMRDMVLLYGIYEEEYARCNNEHMGKSILENIRRRQQLCIEAALMCLLKLGLSKKECVEKLKSWQKSGIYPYKLMFWNLFGKGTVNPFKVRIFAFLFPIKIYYLTMCSIYRTLKR